jgi:hypothetical protein
VTLTVIERGGGDERQVCMAGPFASLQELSEGFAAGFPCVPSDDVLSWNETASLPLLPSPKSLSVFLRMRQAPDFGRRSAGWDFRPEQEINAVSQKALFDLVSETQPDGTWPVYKGESFDIWTPDTGRYNGWIKAETALSWLSDKRRSGARRADGPHAGTQPSVLSDRRTLNALRPRIAFRDVTNRTNQRTAVAALVPGERIITHSAPYLVRRSGCERTEAFALGVLSSRVFDWYVRRIIEGHLTFALLNSLPFPRPSFGERLSDRACELAGRLAAPDDRFADWAEKVGVEHGPLAPDVKQNMIDELDAVVARLYGLNEDQLTHLFETFHEGWDYEPRLAAVMAHFKRLAA